MRVISVQHYPEFGGPHNEIIKLEPFLNDRNVRTTVVLTDRPGTARERLEGNVDLEILPLERFRATLDPRPNGRTLIAFKKDVETIREIIRRHNADVVKIHGPHNPQGAIAAWLEDVPIVWVLSSTLLPSMVRRIGIQYVRRLADAVLLNGKSLSQFYPGIESLAERAFFYYPPIDPDRFRPLTYEMRALIRSEFNLPQTSDVIVAVANITPVKGIDIFVTAAGILAARRPSARFLVAGSVSQVHYCYFERVKEMASEFRLLPDRLKFLGVRSDVERILGAADVAVIASRSEGTTATAGEAMACGVPVIATKVGAVSEVVEDGITGIFVAPRDSQAIADAALALINDPTLRRRMGEAGRRRVIERFGVETCADTHIRAYQCAIEHHARRRRRT